MSAERDEKLYESLTQTGRLLQSVEPVEGETYTLESILAEYGRGAAQPARKSEAVPEAASPARDAGRPASDASQIAGKRGKSPSSRTAPGETSAAPVKPAPAPERPPAPEKPDAEGAPETVRRREPERRHSPRKVREDLRDTQRLPRITPDMVAEARPRREAPPPRRERPVRPAENDLPPDSVSLKDVMQGTVDSVLAENEDGILPPPVSLGDRVRALFARRGSHRPLTQDTERLWAEPAEAGELPPEEMPEPEMDSAEAVRLEKSRCRRLHNGLVLSVAPLLVLLAAAVLEMTVWMPPLWAENALLRGAVWGGGLLAVALLCNHVWRAAAEQLKNRCFSCEAALLLFAAVVLADCVYVALGYGAGTEPMALPAAVGIFLAQWGLLLTSQGRREAFHLADLGGDPPYVASAVEAGACRQKGTLEGYYRLSDRPDDARRCQQLVLPLLVSAATVLSGVVYFSDGRINDALWLWSVQLAAALPLGLPLTAALPLRRLQHRLSRDGSALAGYAGARALGRCRRLLVNENDLFPAGTVAFNGYKVYGEERTRMLSYAAAVTKAAGSPLYDLFAQQLSSEGGWRVEAEALQFCEEGGVSATIRGESVVMGSAYFMRKQHIALPRDLKLPTGVFLAVDGVLGAVFVIKYQPSRNVEWALRSLRRTGLRPVLAVRSGNVTPGLLKRKFGVDSRALYPNVTARLALSSLMGQWGETPNALLYREGLLPLAETVIGAQRLLRAARWGLALCGGGGLAGLLLTYYLTHVGALGVLTPSYMLAFGLLWLLPTLLLSGLVKHF